MRILSKGRRLLREEGAIKFVSQATIFAVSELRKQTYWVGSKCECPICGFTGRGFAPTPRSGRKNAVCPRCGAKERHRLLWHYLERQTEILEEDNRILYFAPTAALETALRVQASVVTTDLAMFGVDLHSDIQTLPFEDDAFDAVICSHVLEHIPDDHAALLELNRVLSTDGEALILVPKHKDTEETFEDESVTSPEGRKKAFGSENHVRWYGMDFSERLEQAGFEVSEITYADHLANEVVDRHGLKVHSQHYGRIMYEDIHSCKKGSSNER